jgi:hypothetical protein
VSDAFRYRLIDEPRPSKLSKIALPPFLVFMVAAFFQPWGFLLIALNAVALNGPKRNREIACALAPIPLYFLALVLLGGLINGGTMTVGQAGYALVAAVGLGLASAAFAYVSQARTFELRRYLSQLRGDGR